MGFVAWVLATTAVIIVGLIVDWRTTMRILVTIANFIDPRHSGERPAREEEDDDEEGTDDDGDEE